MTSLEPGEGAGAPPPFDSDALYLAKCLVADHRYVPAEIPELAPLREVSDIVLIGGDGVGLSIACILDRDADPTRRFTLPPERVDEIAAACQKHAGSMYGMKEDVTVEIWEIGAGVPEPDDWARFESYAFRRVTQKGVSVRGYAVDTADAARGSVFATAADGAARQAWVKQILTSPRRSNEKLLADAKAHDKVARFDTKPYATWALIASFAVMFIVELVWTIRPGNGVTPNITTLIALGGLEHVATEGGEWWRMLTCAFLHGDPWHLLFNCVAMFMAGAVLENLIGRRWMLALFVIGALGGSAASLTINSQHMTSVGASGAIMGLLAAAMVASMRLPKGPARTQILVSLGQILVPSLLPLASKGGGEVDFAAHLGGAVAGAVGGGILLLTWAKDAEHPRGGVFAAVVAAAGLAFTAYGWAQLAGDHDHYVRAFEVQATIARNPDLLVSPETLTALTPEQLPQLLHEHPRDPRLRMNAAQVAIQASDFSGARNHLDVALSDQEALSLLKDPAAFEALLRFLLAVTHEEEGNMELAREAAQPSCKVGATSESAAIRDYYARLCAAP